MKTNKVPLFDQNGQIIGVLGTYEDITARKEAEAALAEASALFQTLLANSPDYIYFKDTESRFVHASRSFSKFLEADCASDLIGKTDFDIFTPDHARAAFDDEQEIIRSGQPIIGKLERETRLAGQTTWALTNKLPWRDKDGNIIGTFGISKDVTAIKETEQKLAYERELFQTLLDTIPDNIYFKNRESQFVRVSRSKVRKTIEPARALYSLKLPEGAPKELPPHLATEDAFANFLIGKTDFDTFDEEFARAALEEECTILSTGEAMIGKLEHLSNPDGTAPWMLITKMPWRDGDGNIIGTFGVSRDVSALKEAEAQLRETQQRLIETSRLTGMAEVATDVLHNVGNVLNSVNVSASLMMDRLRESRTANLAKVASLLKEHERQHWASFLRSDPRGKQVPVLSRRAGRAFRRRTSLFKHELEQLVRAHRSHQANRGHAAKLRESRRRARIDLRNPACGRRHPD